MNVQTSDTVTNSSLDSDFADRANNVLRRVIDKQGHWVDVLWERSDLKQPLELTLKDTEYHWEVSEQFIPEECISDNSLEIRIRFLWGRFLQLRSQFYVAEMANQGD